MNEREVKLVEHRVTCILEHEGRFCIVENVPARVNEETRRTVFLTSDRRAVAEDDPWGRKTEPDLETPVHEDSEQ